MSEMDERFMPGTSRITELESVHRYAAAAALCGNCRVLDLASGEGYGSEILSRSASEVVGLDLSDDAIRNARAKYVKHNLSFLRGNALDIPLPDSGFDRIVSFETLEHVTDQEKLLSEMKRMLKKDGMLILSSPNKTPFRRRNDCEEHPNPYHVKELEPDELKSLLLKYFTQIKIYCQDAFYSSVIAGGTEIVYLSRNTDGDFLRHEELSPSQYSFVLASDNPLPEFPTSFLADAAHDKTYGWLADAEAVVNQFGLRGEYLKVSGELEEHKQRMHILENELLQSQAENGKLLQEKNIADARIQTLDAELRAERDNILRLNTELTNAIASGKQLEAEYRQSQAEAEIAQKRFHEECRKAQMEINGLKTSLSDEQAKSLYLFNELEHLKQAWSLRIFGRFRIRGRIRGALSFLRNGFHRFCKNVYLALPINESRKYELKDRFYLTFGAFLSDVRGYRDWESRRRLLAGLNCNAAESVPDVPDGLPLTSIIIPVYNNLMLTEKCLHSLYSIHSRSPFEVILADDCSTENIAFLKKEFPEIHIVRNHENLGFLRTANRGAKEANGQFLLFLNNDTEVMPNWLDELTCALAGHPEAGMIGSQMIHASTGLLQESGNLICRDGRMLPLGRGETPSSPEFAYFREVDFCSAASCIMRKHLFDQVGGFDTIYAPAYFEDPDLALKFQKAGFRNYVMPLSKIIHHEMASYGAALSEKCEPNRVKFFTRWKTYLDAHALYDSPEQYRRCRRFPRKRLLYLDAEVPMADRGSGGMDAIFFMNYFLKRGMDVVFHGEYTPGYVPKYTTILLRMGVEVVYAPQRQIWDYLHDNGWTFQWLFVSRVYQARSFDRLLKTYCTHAAYIFNTVDLHFVREHLEADLYKQEDLKKRAAVTKRCELAVIRQADATIVISKDEKTLLEKDYAIKNKLWHIPQARAIAGRKYGFAERHGAVFIGSAHHPNLDALAYFHDEILPLLPADFRLTVIGEALRDALSAEKDYHHLLDCPQFHFAGFVAELGDVLHHAKLSIAPLRYGAGTKGKVASSMSYGVPCVSSSFGTEGTGMLNGVHLLIAKTPREFAKHMEDLSTDAELWMKISEGGLKFLTDFYSPEAVEKQMDKLINSIEDARLNPESEPSWRKSPVIPKTEETEN